jgi:hypothetical protein
MITLNELCARLLPSDEQLKFRSLILDEPRMILVAATTAPKAACPDCHHLTDHWTWPHQSGSSAGSVLMTNRA